jgi:prevent-host-death family protein
MTTIGVRELRQNASSYLQRVESGETIQIRSRGRPVALWVPLRPDEEGLSRLEKEMRISAAQGDLLDLGAPLRAVARRQLPGERLADSRKSER